jgi:hypothetical protein
MFSVPGYGNGKGEGPGAGTDGISGEDTGEGNGEATGAGAGTISPALATMGIIGLIHGMGSGAGTPTLISHSSPSQPSAQMQVPWSHTP